MSFAKRNAIRAKFDAKTLNTINIDMNLLNWDKERRMLAMPMWTGSFPDKIFVKSTFTDKIVCFVPDRSKAEMNEFWDGEMMEYLNLSNNVRLTLSRG